jgi:hypothetical protein
MPRTATKGLPRFGPDVTLEEIQDVLNDDGYSANQRKGWLKEVLTDLQNLRSQQHSGELDELIEGIKGIIANHQNGRPISDDTL